MGDADLDSRLANYLQCKSKRTVDQMIEQLTRSSVPNLEVCDKGSRCLDSAVGLRDVIRNRRNCRWRFNRTARSGGGTRCLTCSGAGDSGILGQDSLTLGPASCERGFDGSLCWF